MRQILFAKCICLPASLVKDLAFSNYVILRYEPGNELQYLGYTGIKN